MRFEERVIFDALGTILWHNAAGVDGRPVVKKGALLTEAHLKQLAGAGHTTVGVAVLEVDDVHEDKAAGALAAAMERQHLSATPARDGRANLRAAVDGLLEVDTQGLFEVNMLPGFAVATRRWHVVVGPNQESDNVASLKIVPFAVARRDLERAIELAGRHPGIVWLRPLPPGRRVAMLFVADPPAQDRTRDEYLSPTEARLARLGSEVVATEAVIQNEAAIAAAATRLATDAELLIIAGQTSVTHEEDTTPRALRRAGAEDILVGAPVEPGNLLALAWLPGTTSSGVPVLCAPGCAKGLKFNVVDLVLPRLLLGDRLGRRDVAALGLGGFLTAAERAGGLGQVPS